MKPIATTQRLPRATTLRLFVVGVAIALAISAAGFASRGPIAAFDRLLLDVFVRASASGATDARTVVVDIDEVSLSAVGQWPWPRYRVAALIERIASAKPAAIGLDVLFPEPDRASLVNIRDTFKRDFGVDVAFAGVPDGLLDNDGYLGHTIARHDVVASNYFYFDHFNRAKGDARSTLAIGGDIDALHADRATGVLSNADAIASQTGATGFMNNRLDDDGLLRRVPLVIEHDGALFPSLALATAMKALHVERATVESGIAGPAIRVGSHRVAVDREGFATLRFDGGPSAYPAISAVDVLNGRVDAADLAGKVVYIGSSAVGLNDVHDTAVDARFPGLKIHAVATANLLDGGTIARPPWGPAAALVVSLVAAVAVAWLFACAGPIHVVVLGTIGVAAATALLAVPPFATRGVYVGPAAPLATVASLFVLFSVARFAIEKRRATRWLRQLQNARQVTIESMASVAETRDPETGAHIKRTQHYVKAIALELRRAGLHVETLTDDYIELLFLSAPLHDIGKVGVPDHILLKPGRLTPAEFEIMKQHAEFGRRIILSSAQHIDGDNFLVIAAEIAATHHERWDGGGYPLGLAGEAIPLSGRIMACADIYDALISRRCYKEPFSHELATSMMREARGTIFDPAVLDAFFRIETTIQTIAATYGDEAEEHAGAAATPDAKVASEAPTVGASPQLVASPAS